MDISPQPTDEEAAAIIAALEMSWPRAGSEEAVEPRSSNWRFSGRWWNQPTARGRQRP